MAENINGLVSIQNVETETCSLCLKKKVRYTCPRCNIRYCTVDCYKGEKHMNCSESFYKDCFMEGLKDCDARPAEKQKILEMLARVENEDLSSDPDNGDESLEDRMAGIDLDTDVDNVWNRLSDKEKTEFGAMLHDGRMSELVEVWTPWWTKQSPVEELGTVKDSSVPTLLEEIPDICKLLTKAKPSANIKHNVVNVLYAYCYVLRLRNGCLFDNAVESCQELFQLSDVLSKSVNFDRTSDAIQDCLKNLCDVPALKTSQDFSTSIIQDVMRIITGPTRVLTLTAPSLEYIQAALSDLHRLVKSSLHDLATDIKKNKTDLTTEGMKAWKRKLFLAEKKVLFLLSWSQRYGMALYAMVPMLDLEYSALFVELESVSAIKQKVEASWGNNTKLPVKKAMITEIG